MSEPPPLPTTPPLEDLVRHEVRDDEVEDIATETFELGGSFYLRPRLPKPTWRHKLYWFLRSCIDWIHP